MRTAFNQKGFSHTLVLVAAVVIAVVSVVGLRLLDGGAPTGSQPSSSAVLPANIKTQADLNQAQKALDATAVDSSVNPEQLDTDINALL